MGGRLFEGLTDATLCTARRPMGSDPGFSSWPRRPRGRHGGRQPIVRRSGFVSISGRHPVAGSSRAFRRLEDRPPALRPVGEERSDRVFTLLASDHDNEYMMIDATIVRAHQHSAGARKKTANKRSVDPAAD